MPSRLGYPAGILPWLSCIMTSDILRIATRQSRLALWQAEHVAARLRTLHPQLSVELVGITTQGDRIRDTPLANLGGKGLFIKELEVAILEGRADIAVHSMKDVTVEFPGGLHLPVILEREDPLDAFVSNDYAHPDQLPANARVGTCSLRRQCQLAARYPHLDIIPLRGNVDTRLRRLDEGRFEAIVLAAAGLKRLGLASRIRSRLDPALSLPAIGQGAIGIECRIDDPRIEGYLQGLKHRESWLRVSAERGLNARLQGSCQVPIAGFAELEGEQLRLRGLVGTPDGQRIIQGERTGIAAEAEALGWALGEELLARGAAGILQSLRP